MTEAEKVQVLDAAGPPPRSGGGGGGGSLLVAVAALVLGAALWVGSGLGASTDLETASPEPPSLSDADEAAPAVMPDLFGASFDEVAPLLAEAGVLREVDVESTWLASDRLPTGGILGQDPAAGANATGPVRLTVSAGGPVVEFRELPSFVREWVVSLPGFDAGEPILATPTAAGTAYKTDRWLFGECAAVALAYQTYPDGAYDEDCFTRATSSVAGVLLDGTPYFVAGLPAGDYPLRGVAGVIVVESAGAARALGITTHQIAESPVAPVARLAADRIQILAGTWSTEIALQPQILKDLEGAALDELVAAIHPDVVEGFPVVDLDPPLRWQEPGEIPSRIEVDYGHFRVVAGCVRNVTNVVCDPTQSISVEGVGSGFDVSGVTVGISMPEVPRRVVSDDRTRLTAEVPAAWFVAAEPLTASAEPREIFSVGTYALEPGTSLCSHVPEQALRDMGSEDVLVTVFETGSVLAPWPRPFARSDLQVSGSGFDVRVCAERDDVVGGVGFYRLSGLSLIVFVALGEDVPVATEVEVWRLLDSLEVST